VWITRDPGTEFMSRVLGDWAYARGVQLEHTRPGKPTDNSYIESFNGKLRDECLNVTQIADIAHAQQVIAALRTDRNEARPHGALGYLPPKEFADARLELPPKKRRNSTAGCLHSGPRSVVRGPSTPAACSWSNRPIRSNNLSGLLG